MRYTAKTLSGTTVWDDSRSARISGVVWVDDEKNQYGTHVKPFKVIDGELLVAVVQVRKLVIYAPLRLVIVNPVVTKTYDVARSLHDLLGIC